MGEMGRTKNENPMNNKKKMGRPKSENPINIQLKAKVDKSTNEKVIAYCERHGITISELVRRGLELVFQSETKKDK